MKKFNLKNTFGFSLVEMMIAVGVAGLASLALLEMTKSQINISSKAKTDIDVDAVLGVVGQLVSQAGNCEQTLLGQAINIGGDTDFNSIRNKNGVVILSTQILANARVEARRININRIILSDITVSNEEVIDSAGAPRQKAMGYFFLEIQKVGFTEAQGFKQNAIRKRIPKAVEIILDGNQIESCSTGLADISKPAVNNLCESLRGQGPFPLEEPADLLKCEMALITGPFPIGSTEEELFEPDRTGSSQDVLKEEFNEELVYLADNYLQNDDRPQELPGSPNIKNRIRDIQGTLTISNQLTFSGAVASLNPTKNMVISKDWAMAHINMEHTCKKNELAFFANNKPSCMRLKNNSSLECSEISYPKSFDGKKISCIPFLKTSPDCSLEEGKILINPSNGDLSFKC